MLMVCVSYVFLRHVQPVLGYEHDHASAATELKKHLKGDALKSNKAFVDAFFVRFSETYEKTRLSELKARIGSQSADDALPEQETAAKAVKSAWAWYTSAYAPKPSKEQLAAFHSDASLKRLAGHYNANLGTHAAAHQAELAKAALAKLPTVRPLILIDAAQAHAERVAKALEDAGAKDLHVVAGGADRWYELAFSLLLSICLIV